MIDTRVREDEAKTREHRKFENCKFLKCCVTERSRESNELLNERERLREFPISFISGMKDAALREEQTKRRILTISKEIKKVKNYSRSCRYGMYPERKKLVKDIHSLQTDLNQCPN